MDAYETVKELKNINWLELLQKASFALKLSSQLKKVADDIEQGKDYDFGSLVQTFNIIEGKQHNGVTMSDVVAMQMPFISSGWEAIDTHLIGYPIM